MFIENQIHLLDELQELLEKQIALAKQDGAGELEVLIERTDLLIEKISGTGILESPEFKNRKEHLQKLYEALCLSVAAKKTDVCEKLGQIRRSRKTMEIYNNNM
jgi:hypothetical protein